MKAASTLPGAAAAAAATAGLAGAVTGQGPANESQAGGPTGPATGDGYAAADPNPAAALMATAHRPSGEPRSVLTGPSPNLPARRDDNPIPQFVADVMQRNTPVGDIDAGTFADLLQDVFHDAFPLLTHAQPLQVLWALTHIGNSPLLGMLYRDSHDDYAWAWSRILAPIRAIVTSDTSSIVLKDAALRVLMVTDTQFATRYLDWMLLRPKDTVQAAHRELALSAFGRLPTVPEEAARILQQTAKDSTLPVTTRVAAIRGLARPSSLPDLVPLAITDTDPRVRARAFDAVQSVIAQSGNDTPEATAALELTKGYLNDPDVKVISNAQLLVTAWVERGVPVLADVYGSPEWSRGKLYVLSYLQDDPNITAAVARLLAHTNPDVRKTVTSYFAEIWGIDLAVGAVGMLGHDDVAARTAAEEIIRMAGQPRVDFDAPMGYSRNRRGELAERLIAELERISAPATPSGTAFPKNRYRPSVDQVLRALEMMGMDAWPAIQERYRHTPFNIPMYAQLKGLLDAIAAAALPKAREQFTSTDPKQREAAAHELILLGKYAVPTMVDFLTTVVSADDAVVSTRAAEALVQMGVPAFEALQALAEGPPSIKIFALTQPLMDRLAAKIAEVWASRRSDPSHDGRYGRPDEEQPATP